MNKNKIFSLAILLSFCCACFFISGCKTNSRQRPSRPNDNYDTRHHDSRHRPPHYGDSHDPHHFEQGKKPPHGSDFKGPRDDRFNGGKNPPRPHDDIKEPRDSRPDPHHIDNGRKPRPEAKKPAPNKRPDGKKPNKEKGDRADNDHAPKH